MRFSFLLSLTLPQVSAAKDSLGSLMQAKRHDLGFFTQILLQNQKLNRFLTLTRQTFPDLSALTEMSKNARGAGKERRECNSS